MSKSNANKLLTLMSGGGASGISLPYTFDPSALGDGALPAPWVGSTFAIDAGKIVNTPEVGPNLITGGDFEGTFTDGLNEILTKAGTPTVTESADVHGGSKAQAFTGSAIGVDYLYLSHTPIANRWYIFSLWTKRLSGSADGVHIRHYQASGKDFGYEAVIDGAAYEQLQMPIYAANTNSLILYPAIERSATHDAIVFDDIAHQIVTTSSLIASVDTGITDMVVKSRWENAVQPNLLRGHVARLDSDSNPQNYLFAWMVEYQNTGWLYVGLAEVVNGVATKLIDNTYIAAANDATKDLEIRCNGDQVGLYYDSAQVDTDKTTNVLTGTRAGLFHFGGSNKANRFFVE